MSNRVLYGDLSSDIQNLMRKVDVAEEEIKAIPNPTFNYYLFLGTFLPYFIGEKDPKEASIRSKWAHIANDNLYQAVDLVDDDGNIVDIVPPILDSGSYLESELAKKIDGIVITLKTKGKNAPPGVAEQRFINRLNSIEPKIKDHKTLWKRFLGRCIVDRDTIRNSDTDTETINENTNVIDDDFEFDD